MVTWASNHDHLISWLQSELNSFEYIYIVIYMLQQSGYSIQVESFGVLNLFQSFENSFPMK